VQLGYVTSGILDLLFLIGSRLNAVFAFLTRKTQCFTGFLFVHVNSDGIEILNFVDVSHKRIWGGAKRPCPPKCQSRPFFLAYAMRYKFVQ